MNKEIIDNIRSVFQEKGVMTAAEYKEQEGVKAYRQAKRWIGPWGKVVKMVGPIEKVEPIEKNPEPEKSEKEEDKTKEDKE